MEAGKRPIRTITEDLARDIVKLREENKNLMHELSEMRSINQDLLTELDATMEECSALKKENAELHDRLTFTQEGEASRLKDENETLQHELKWTRNEMTILQAQLDIVYRIFPDRYDSR